MKTIGAALLGAWFSCAMMMLVLADINVDGYEANVVLVEQAEGCGTGVIVRNGEHEFVWTAAHVVDNLEKVATVVDPVSGKPKLEVTYTDAKVVRLLKKDNRIVGEEFRYAEILRYSDSELGYDLCLLRSRSPIAKTGAKWATSTPKVGTEVFHIGCPEGRKGYNTFIQGSVSATNRPRDSIRPAPEAPKLDMTQFTLSITRGCSGGPVFSKPDGKVIAIVTQIIPSNYSIAFGIPTEVVQKFAKEAKCEWAFDTSIPVPDNFRLASPRRESLPIPTDWKVTPSLKKKDSSIPPIILDFFNKPIP